VAKKGIEFTR